jgi:hypothetical protein
MRTSTLPAVQAGLICAAIILSVPILSFLPWTDGPGYWRHRLSEVAWGGLACTLMSIPIPALLMFATLGQARRVTVKDLDSAVGLRLLCLSFVALLPVGATWAGASALRSALSPPLAPAGALDLGPVMNRLVRIVGSP